MHLLTLLLYCFLSYCLLVEMELEVGRGLVGNFLVVPCSDCMVVDASLLEQGEGELDGSIIGNGFATSGCHLEDGPNSFPQVFKRFVGFPCVVSGGDGAIGGDQVGNDGWCVNVGVFEFFVFQGLIIQWVDGGQHKLAKGFVDLLIGGKFLAGFVIDAVVFSDLSTNSVDTMWSLGSGVDWSNEGGSSSNEIGCVGHDSTKVAVGATAELAMGGTSVGIYFFLELLDGNGGRFAVNVGELHMGERKSCGDHGCCC
jgi:hypothetical protein